MFSFIKGGGGVSWGWGGNSLILIFGVIQFYWFYCFRENLKGFKNLFPGVIFPSIDEILMK